MKARLNPLVFGVRLSVLVELYRRRLRDHTTAELLAGGGVAVGVALIFGVLVSNGNIVGSVREDVHAVSGSATLQFIARTPAGFSERLAGEVTRLPGIESSAPLLRQSAVIEGPSGRERAQFVGVSAGLIALGGSATKDLGAGALVLADGVGLPSDLARRVGVEARQKVTLVVAGAASAAPVRVVLDSAAIGPLAFAPIVVARLSYAQAVSGQPSRVNDVLVKPLPGRYRQVEGELRGLAGSTIDVKPADSELTLAETAAKPVDQSTSLFVAIAAMVGFLLALNAMLLTVPERRRAIADMRVQGFDSRQVLTIVVSQAMLLGIVASCVGVIAGDLLAHVLFNDVPSYLTTVFPITGHQTVEAGAVVLAFGCGLVASMLASLAPVFDLRSGRPVDAVLHELGEPGQGISRRTTLRMTALGVTIVILVTAGVALDASLTILAGVMLAVAALCLIPLLFRMTTRVMKQFARRFHGGMVAVTAIEMEATATRSIALAGVAALAVYGSLAVGGARHDLLRGLDEAIVQEWGSAPVWVSPDGNIFDADTFRIQHQANTLGQAANVVASVHVHQGGFVDLGTHRLWIRGVPRNNSTMILSSQLLEGDLTSATERLRQAGWATVSDGFAKEHDLRVGSWFVLPTPSGSTRFRVAAVTTNMGWPSGTITVNTTDYSRHWLTSAPTTLSFGLRPGVTAASAKSTLAGLLKDQPSLRVQTSEERIAEVESTVHQGLRTLSQISTLLLVIAALALAAALSTAIYQRRSRLASLKEQGFDHLQLWRSLLLESAIVLGLGCLDGVVMGIYGHAIADRYLREGGGFPAPFSIGGVQVIVTLLLLLGIALAVIALPGYSAAGVSPRASFQE
jgi:putative ABC transport system permease protein